jgi:uncharacterized protein
MRVEVGTALTVGLRREWQVLAGSAGLYSSYEWLTLVEGETRGECRYLLARGDDGRLAAALPVYLVREEPNPQYRPSAHFPALARALGAAPVALAAGHGGYRAEILVDPWLSEESRMAAVSALIRALRELLAEPGPEGRDYCFFFFLTATAATVLDALPDLGCRPVLHYVANAMLPRVGETFDDYLALIRARRRKDAAGREIRRFQEAGLRTEQADPLDHLSRTAELVGQLQDRYGAQGNRGELEAMLAQQYDLLGPAARLFICRSGRKILGVAVAYEWEGWLYLRQGGFDYTALPGAYEYFNLAFYEPLRYCYRHGLAGLRLGVGSDEAKMLRGALMEPLSALVLPLNPGVSDPVWPRAREGAARHWAAQRARFTRAFDSDLWGRPAINGGPVPQGPVDGAKVAGRVQ